MNHYDKEGRIIHEIKQHFKAGISDVGNYDELTKTYNFPGQIINQVRKHYGVGAENLYYKTDFTCDYYGRVADLYQITGTNSNTITNTAILLSRNEYNEVGQLKRKMYHINNKGDTFASLLFRTKG